LAPRFVSRLLAGSPKARAAARAVAPRDAAPLDPEFAQMIRESLADPRPDRPASEVFARLDARHRARLEMERQPKRGR
jgi:hypothetical protein